MMLLSGSFDDQKSRSILSTEGMLNHVKKSKSKNFVVATETGILYRMRKQNPHKTFHSSFRESRMSIYENDHPSKSL